MVTKQNYIAINNNADYRITASLLNSFQWYMQSENNNAEQQLLDTINRIPAVYTEPQAKGKSFESVINKCLENDGIYKMIQNSKLVKAVFTHGENEMEFTFNTDLISKVLKLMRNQNVFHQQAFVSKKMVDES